MKTFVTWLTLAAFSFGALAGGYHVYLDSNPRRVAVVLDASFPMRDVWHQVPPTLDTLQGEPYTVYALLTEKGTVHEWSERLSPGRTSPYAPRDFKRLDGRRGDALLADADEVYFVTNAADSDVEPFDDWVLIRPGG